MIPKLHAKPLHQVSEELFLSAHAEQVDKGLAEYGKTLHAFNGRNAADDCRRELVDALDYLTQLEMERDAYEVHAEALFNALEHLRSGYCLGGDFFYDDEAVEAADKSLAAYREATK